MKLVIFDLDQTLVDFIPIHDKAAEQAFRELFGVKARLTEIDFAGRSLIENWTTKLEISIVPGETPDQ